MRPRAHFRLFDFFDFQKFMTRKVLSLERSSFGLEAREAVQNS